jgi:hypothetical protein
MADTGELMENVTWEVLDVSVTYTSEGFVIPPEGYDDD